jgi:hypothetical protein
MPLRSLHGDFASVHLDLRECLLLPLLTFLFISPLAFFFLNFSLPTLTAVISHTVPRSLPHYFLVLFGWS